MLQNVSSEMVPSVYYHSSKPGQTLIGMFLGTFWSPPKNIPAPIEALGEMPLENYGMQDNASTFAQNSP